VLSTACTQQEFLDFIEALCLPRSPRVPVPFEEMRALFGQRAKRYKGSYSILAETSAETVAKIVVYQQGVTSRDIFPRFSHIHHAWDVTVAALPWPLCGGLGWP
jgi:hypothetical protein